MHKGANFLTILPQENWMRIRRTGCLLLVAIAAFSMSTQKAYALLAGTKTTGMAATSVSYPIDAFAGAYNPAAITILPDRVDLGLNWVHFKQDLNVHDNHSILNSIFPNNQLNGHRNAARTPDVYVPEFGAVKHFCFDMCGCPIDLTAGLVVYNRNYLKTTYTRPIPLLGNTRPGLEFLHETVAPMVAIRLWEQHSLGVSVNFNVQRVKVNGLQNFANPLFSSSPTNATNKGYNWSTGCGVTLGYLFQPTDCFRVGLSWTPKTGMKKFNKYKGFIANHGEFPTPMRFQAGLSYDIWRCLTVAFDYEYIQWKDIPHLKNLFYPNVFTSHLGDKNGAGFGWNHQQHYFRFGAQYSLNDCWDFRIGYRYATQPIKRKSAAVNLLTCDTVQNVLTLGATYHLNCRNEFSILYAHGFSNTVKGDHSIPTELTPLPPFPTLQPVFGGGEADVKQNFNVLGVSWGILF